MKFAKLYERDGQQVLVTKEQGEDDEPCLQVRFKSDIGEHDVSMRVLFKRGAEDLWHLMDEAFDAMTEEKAFDIRDKTPGAKL